MQTHDSLLFCDMTHKRVMYFSKTKSRPGVEVSYRGEGTTKYLVYLLRRSATERLYSHVFQNST